MTVEFMKRAADCLSVGENVVVVTIVATSGTVPARPGQMLLVGAGGAVAGTVGGGRSEHEVIERARQAIANGEDVFELDAAHTEDDCACSGSIRVVGSLIQAKPQLFIFGGGHVGQHLAPAAAAAGFGVTVVEDRADLSALFEPYGFVEATPDIYAERLRVPHAAYAVICTRGHKTDFEALRYCVTQDFRYIGMIGSRSKVQSLYAKLPPIPDDIMHRIYSPVGLDIADGTPKEIAVSIVAEMLVVKNGTTARHRRVSFDEGR